MSLEHEVNAVDLTKAELTDGRGGDVIVNPDSPIERIIKKLMDLSLGKALDVARIGIQHPPALAQSEKTLKHYHNGLLRSAIVEVRNAGLSRWPTLEEQKKLEENFRNRRG
jgi:hypothetical protein